LRTVWESSDSEGLASIGCINSYCCDAALYYVKSKYDYLVYFTFVAAFLGLINYATLVLLISFLSLYTIKRIRHGRHEYAIGIAILATLIGTVIFLIVGISGPHFFPYLTTSTTASSTVIEVESRFYEFDGYFDIFNIVI
jgi:hypothetical protein